MQFLYWRVHLWTPLRNGSVPIQARLGKLSNVSGIMRSCPYPYDKVLNQYPKYKWQLWSTLTEPACGLFDRPKRGFILHENYVLVSASHGLKPEPSLEYRNSYLSYQRNCDSFNNIYILNGSFDCVVIIFHMWTIPPITIRMLWVLPE